MNEEMNMGTVMFCVKVHTENELKCIHFLLNCIRNTLEFQMLAEKKITDKFIYFHSKVLVNPQRFKGNSSLMLPFCFPPVFFCCFKSCGTIHALKYTFYNIKPLAWWILKINSQLFHSFSFFAHILFTLLKTGTEPHTWLPGQCHECQCLTSCA